MNEPDPFTTPAYVPADQRVLVIAFLLISILIVGNATLTNYDDYQEATWRAVRSKAIDKHYANMDESVRLILHNQALIMEHEGITTNAPPVIP